MPECHPSSFIYLELEIRDLSGILEFESASCHSAGMIIAHAS